jgi:dihydrolipoamide dehydrogenase
VIAEAAELTADWGVEFAPPRIAIDKVRARKEKIVTTLSSGLQQLAKRRKVRVIQARGQLEDATTLRLEGDAASLPDDRQLEFDHLILATGSAPFAAG